MPVLIDCYNLLHCEMPASLAGLDERRLCDALARSPWVKQRVFVVCDGAVKPDGPAASGVPGVELVYSGGAASADDVIERMINDDSAPRRLTVVSNDRQIQKAARRRKARVMSCEHFIRALAGAAGRAAKQQQKPRKSDGYMTSPQLAPHEVDEWMAEFGIELEENADDNTSDSDDDMSDWRKGVDPL